MWKYDILSDYIKSVTHSHGLGLAFLLENIFTPPFASNLSTSIRLAPLTVTHTHRHTKQIETIFVCFRVGDRFPQWVSLSAVKEGDERHLLCRLRGVAGCQYLSCEKCVRANLLFVGVLVVW